MHIFCNLLFHTLYFWDLFHVGNTKLLFVHFNCCIIFHYNLIPSWEIGVYIFLAITKNVNSMPLFTWTRAALWQTSRCGVVFSASLGMTDCSPQYWFTLHQQSMRAIPLPTLVTIFKKHLHIKKKTFKWINSEIVSCFLFLWSLVRLNIFSFAQKITYVSFLWITCLYHLFISITLF